MMMRVGYHSVDSILEMDKRAKIPTFWHFCEHTRRGDHRRVHTLFHGDDDQGIRPVINRYVSCSNTACIAAATTAISEKWLEGDAKQAAIERVAEQLRQRLTV